MTTQEAMLAMWMTVSTMSAAAATVTMMIGTIAPNIILIVMMVTVKMKMTMERLDFNRHKAGRVKGIKFRNYGVIIMCVFVFINPFLLLHRIKP